MKPKKSKRSFLLLFATIALAFGFGSALQQKVITETKAVAIPSNQALYLKPSTNWLDAGARFAAYFYGGGEAWVDAVKETGVLDIYKVVAPASYTNVIFTRMNPGTTENNWGNKWTQSPNLEFDGTNDLYRVSGWDTGAWDVYDPLDHPLPPSFAGGLALFFKPSGSFMTGATRMAAHFFIADGGATPKWALMTEVDLGIYRVETPATGVSGKEFDRVIFVSMVADDTADAFPEFDWAYKVDQTVNLIHESGKVLYDNSEKSWKAFSERSSVTLTATTEGINIDKVRIWLDRSGHFEDGFTWALKVGTTLYQPTGFEKAISLTPTTDRFFAYYDMPTSVLSGNIGFSVVNSFLKVDLEITPVAYVTGDNNKVWKVDYVVDQWTFTKGAITERIHNTFFAKVLEGYLTCDSSAVNGYGAFTAFDNNFLPRAEGVWNMEGDLGGVMIKDFESIGDYATGTREAVASTDAYAKYTLMGQKAGLIPTGGEPNPYRTIQKTGSNVGLIIIVSLFALGTLTFIRLRKKTA